MPGTDTLQLLDRSPFLFRVAKGMVRHKLPGGWKLFTALDWTGYLNNKLVKYPVSQSHSVFVPANSRDRWDGLDLLSYEPQLVAALVEAASKCVGPLTIIDCGANIGIISVLLAARLNDVARLIAFEPGDTTFPILRRNLAELPLPAEAVQMAISDFNGRGELRAPSYDSSDHAHYVVQVPEGGFPVTRIDDQRLDTPNLLIKIDVEGAEIAVIRGAADSIAKAHTVILSIEAHPKVFERTRIDPITVLQAIAALRPFDFTIAETGESITDLSRPFFEQLPNDGTIYNIVCVSVPSVHQRETTSAH